MGFDKIIGRTYCCFCVYESDSLEEYILNEIIFYICLMYFFRYLKCGFIKIVGREN